MSMAKSDQVIDSKLEVHSRSGKPHRWILRYQTDTGMETDEVELLLYNYLGARSCRVLQNQHLPSRHAAIAAT